jgi:hypothetical protein
MPHTIASGCTRRDTSDQHALLLGRDVDPNLVYYAAPTTHRVEDLNRAFLTRAVIEESIFFRPRDIGPLPDNDAHCIAFVPGAPVGYRCSDDAAEVRANSVGASILEKLGQDLAQLHRVEDSTAYFTELASELAAVAAERSNARPSARQELGGLIEDPSRRAAYLTRTILGAELLWVTERRE